MLVLLSVIGRTTAIDLNQEDGRPCPSMRSITN